MADFKQQLRGLTDFILSRPIASTIFAILPLWFLLDTASFFADGPHEFGDPLGWVAAASLVVVPVTVALMPRLLKDGADAVLIPRWSLAYTPFVLAFGSYADGGAEWLAGPAFIEGVAIVILSMRAARKARGTEDQPLAPS